MASRKKKSAARKKAAGPKKTTKKKASRKKAGGRKAPARKKTARKKAPIRKKAPARKAAAARKPVAAGDPMQAVAKKIIDAGIDADSHSLEDLYTTDCQSLEAGSPEPAVGLDGLREKLANWGKMQESASFKPVNVWTGKNTVAIEWEGKVKLRGGPTVSLKEVAVHEIRNGKIQRERYYYNPMALAPGGGAPPAAEEPDESAWDSDDSSEMGFE